MIQREDDECVGQGSGTEAERKKTGREEVG